MTDRVGEQLGNYHLVNLIGRGGFAEVYLGEHIHLNTQAAIKVLHAQLASEVAERFLTEARTIARLVHPHIVRVLDYGIEDNTPFLVMDYASNGTLRQRHPHGVSLPLSDQYSLGIVVYEWLCGAQPFKGTFTEMYSQHLHSPPPSLHEKIPSISLDVEQVVLKALSKDPQRRFVSVRAFAHALEMASISSS